MYRSLVSNTKNVFLYSFIDVKNRNELQYPSQDVLKICMTSEKFLKKEIVAFGANSYCLKQL